jgi:hypothetical protein
LEQRPTGQSSRIPTRASQPGSFSDLTAIQENLLNQTRDQLSNAVESGEDQMTGRVKQQLQRNEDYDLGQIDVLEDIAEYNRIQGMEQDEPISSVASSLPDGLPTDQAERLQGQSTSLPTRANQPGSFSDLTNIQNNLLEQARRSSFLKAKREQVQSKREQLLDVEHKIYDMVASAAEKGIKMEPNRALQIITNPTIELNQEELSLFQINPELGKFALKGQTFEPGQSQTGANLSILGERLKSVPNIGSDPQAFVKQAASGTSIRGRSRIQNEPDEFRQRVSSQGRPVEDDFVFVDEGGTVTVYPGEELTELALEETPSPRYQRFARDPFTQKMKEEYAPKGMRAVNTVEGRPYFVPATDPGGVGIYGIERSYASGPVVKVDLPAQGRVAGAYTKTALRSPTELPFTERYPKGGAGFSQMSSPQLRTFIENAPEGRVRQAGELEMSRRENSKQSLQVSEALRRANIEGRDPQVVLRDLGFNV